jgi:hypothetical protein
VSDREHFPECNSIRRDKQAHDASAFLTFLMKARDSFALLGPNPTR